LCGGRCPRGCALCLPEEGADLLGEQGHQHKDANRET
jgi:hypothetical protein